MYEGNTEYIYSTHREMYYPRILIQLRPIKAGVHTNIAYILLAEKQRTSIEPVERQSSERNIWIEGRGSGRKLQKKAKLNYY
jgi:hypothetical protein